MGSFTIRQWAAFGWRAAAGDVTNNSQTVHKRLALVRAGLHGLSLQRDLTQQRVLAAVCPSPNNHFCSHSALHLPAHVSALCSIYSRSISPHWHIYALGLSVVSQVSYIRAAVERALCQPRKSRARVLHIPVYAKRPSTFKTSTRCYTFPQHHLGAPPRPTSLLPPVPIRAGSCPHPLHYHRCRAPRVRLAPHTSQHLRCRTSQKRVWPADTREHHRGFDLHIAARSPRHSMLLYCQPANSTRRHYTPSASC